MQNVSLYQAGEPYVEKLKLDAQREKVMVCSIY